MRFRRAGLLAGSLTAAALLVAALAAQTGVAAASTSAGHHHGHVLFVAKSGHKGAADRSCRSAAHRTISGALKAAPPRSTVVVCRGTYHEQVAITKPVSLRGKHAVIDQKGVTPSYVADVPGIGKLPIFAGVVIVSSHVSVRGFVVRNALGEGILAAGLDGTIHGVAIRHNAVLHNDLGGGVPPASDYFECQPAGPIPGDCGEGVHFIAVAYSTVSGNLVAHNSGGILLTDETGPTHDNVIANNTVTRNDDDCGITVPGHNPNALSASGKRQPKVAGVYRNLIVHNRVVNNGTKGEGAGVLFANAQAGTASYDNVVLGNYIAGNGLPGVTMHAHTLAPGQFEDLSGNKVIGNAIGKNNLIGDPLDGSIADPVTTGVLVFSGGTPVHVVVAANRIFDNQIGIWLSKPVHAAGLHTNHFRHVKTPISAGN
ncbi:MAG TPA: NosD domain-containing protein [Streptosporangiaceae bacterium]|jgi:parallel beta-helix repeat protein